MKAKDIKPCFNCGQGVMHKGIPLFWEVTVRRMGVDAAAVRQVAGLETMLGSVALARVMGPDPDVAKPIGDTRTLFCCEQCAAAEVTVYQLGLGGDESE
jgi:hypothetical protein